MEIGNLSRQTTGGLVWTMATSGILHVWERPRPHCRYLVTVRPGGAWKLVGGKRDRERSVILVLRKGFTPEGGEEQKRVPTRLAARLVPPVVLDPTPLAEIVAMVSEWYGGVLTFVEVKDGPILAKECQLAGVSVQIQERLELATSEFKKDIGWLTDDENGPAAINALVNAIRETPANGPNSLQIECPHVLAELKTFTPDAGDAPAVSHDDDVRALATGIFNLDAATLLRPETRPRVAPADGWRVVDSFA